MYKIGEDEMVICPYNRSHVVRKLRIQNHIVKCKKNYPDVNLTSCLYNYSHKLKPEDKLEHLKHCSHKARLEGVRYCTAVNYASGNSSVKSEPQIFCSKPLPNTVQYMSWKHIGQSSTEMSSSDDFDSSDKESKLGSVKLQKQASEKLERNKITKEDSSSDEELEPLPLPKTHSKAFILAKEEQAKNDGPLWGRSFGRGKNFLAYSSPKPPRRTDHLLPVVSSIASDRTRRSTGSTFPSRSGRSIASEIIDDSTTLQSDSVILEDDFDDEDDDFYDITKGLEHYIKIEK